MENEADLELQSKVIARLAVILKVEESSLTPATSLRKDLGVDSMTLMNIALDMEEEFTESGIEFDLEAFDNTDTIAEIITVIKNAPAV